MTEEKVNGQRSHWRFDTSISLPMVGALVFQTLVFTWFLATQSKTLSDVVAATAKSETTAYTKADAFKEREFQVQVQKNESDKLDELTRRITILEGQASTVRSIIERK